jgi:hypothetical protein
LTSKAYMISMADSCWPRPVLPSKPPVYHLKPQVVPSAPPEQAAAAPAAEV